MSYDLHCLIQKNFKEYLVKPVLPVSVCMQKRIFDNGT